MDPDLELLERWRGGDRTAGSQLFDRHFNGLRIYFAARLPPEQDAADLIQDTFLRMVEARDRFEGRSTVRTFLFHIARHVLFEALRRRYRPQGAFDPLSESIAELSGRSQSSILAQSEELQLLLDALRSIPSEQYDLIEFHYFQGLKQVEIAEILGIPDGTIKSRMSAARRRLAERFLELSGQSRTDSSIEEILEARKNMGVYI